MEHVLLVPSYLAVVKGGSVFFFLIFRRTLLSKYNLVPFDIHSYTLSLFECSNLLCQFCLSHIKAHKTVHERQCRIV